MRRLRSWSTRGVSPPPGVAKVGMRSYGLGHRWVGGWRRCRAGDKGRGRGFQLLRPSARKDASGPVPDTGARNSVARVTCTCRAAVGRPRDPPVDAVWSYVRPRDPAGFGRRGPTVARAGGRSQQDGSLRRPTGRRRGGRCPRRAGSGGRRGLRASAAQIGRGGGHRRLPSRGWQAKAPSRPNIRAMGVRLSSRSSLPRGDRGRGGGCRPTRQDGSGEGVASRTGTARPGGRPSFSLQA